MIGAAMVLAAGRGERMRPLSDALPKPALPLLDEPVVASPIRLAVAAGAPHVVVNTWHLADEMAAALSEIEVPAEVIVSREGQLMGTAGGLAVARDRGLLGTTGPVLVVNGDGRLDLDVGPVLRRFSAGDVDVALALLPHLDPQRWSRVLLDDSGRVRRIEPPGRPGGGEAPFLYPGVMAVSRPALDGLAAGPGEIPERLWRPALAAGRLAGVVVSGHWREIGTPEAYLEAALGRLGGRLMVHPSATIHPGASVASSLVGREAVVEAGAVVTSSVVAHGAVVGRGARVTGSVLLGAGAARADERLEGAFRGARRPPRRR